MTKRKTYLAWGATLALGALSASSAQAAYVVTFEQVGSNVVDGAINLTDLVLGSTPVEEVPSVTPALGRFFSGDINASATLVMYGMINPPEPIQFGPGSRTVGHPTSGRPVGVFSGEAGDLPTIFLDLSYVSGAELSDSSTYRNATLASLGLRPGAHVINWGVGADADSFTIDVVASPSLSVPEPSTSAMMVVGFAGLGYVALRRKGAVPAIPA